MKTLRSPAFNRVRYSRRFSSLFCKVGNPPGKYLQGISFGPSRKQVAAVLMRVVTPRRKSVLHICRSATTTDSQGNLEKAVETENLEIYRADQMVHLKFQIEKECCFGEQIMLVGDDQLLGLWDPDGAVSLNWSDGHLWGVELDIPVGKTFLYKFIVKRINGDILWQSGPDRRFQTCTGEKTVIILEDWENASLQKIVEEDPSLSFKMNLAANPDTDSIISDEHPEGIKLLASYNTACMQEKPGILVANNITYVNMDSDKRFIWNNVAEASVSGQENCVDSVRQISLISNLVGQDHSHSQMSNVAEPILVPGLSSRSVLQKEALNIAEGVRSQDNELHGAREVEYLNKPEEALDDQSLEKDESLYHKSEGKMEISNETEIQQLGVDTEQDGATEVSSAIVENDIQWIQKATQRFLQSFKFL